MSRHLTNYFDNHDPPSARCPPAGMEAGVQIGDFRIETRLGAGGMGIVYRARQISLNRVVALKVLGSALDRVSDIVRFQREAQAIALLKHPGIATVHYIGQDDQLCYMAMEYIDGISIRKAIDELRRVQHADSGIDEAARRLSNDQWTALAMRFDQPTVTFVSEKFSDGPTSDSDDLSAEAKQRIGTEKYIRRCCEIVRDAALALAHAHERGVVHRDVKPENLILDRDGKVHVIDFGIARFFEDVTVTQTGQLIGTPMYMSPEQVTGRIELDHRTDVYSLGLVLYELLTLRRPILAPTRDALLRKIVTKATPPISWRNNSVARDLENVIHQASAKDPDERYQTASKFAADLDHYLAGRPILAKRYRYSLDNAEIAATRPDQLFGVVVAFMLVGVVSGILGLVLVLGGMFWSATQSVPASSLGATVLPGMIFLMIGVCIYFVGNGVWSGQVWARRVAIVVTMLVMAALACFTGGLLVYNWFQGASVGLAIFCGALPLGASAVVLFRLLQKRTKDWVEFVRSLRIHGT